MDFSSIPMSRFLSGRSDELNGFIYLKGLMNEATTRQLIFEHIKQLIHKGQITLKVDTINQSFRIPSPSITYGGMVIDQTVTHKFDKPVLHPTLPQVMAIGINKFGIPDCCYCPMELVQVQFNPIYLNELMMVHYARWRPPYVILKNQGSKLPIEINSEEEKQ